MRAKTKAKPPGKQKRERVPLPSAVIGYLSSHQVCDALGVSPRTLATLLKTKQFPPADKRVGCLKRWSIPLVNRALEDGFDT